MYLIILKVERRLFTNQMYDEESKLYYMNARYYDPQLGSFITSDPGMQGMNHYAYANSNPVRYTDPTGLDWGSDGDDSMDMSGGGESGQGGLSANGDDNSPCMPAGFLAATNDFLGNLNDPCQSYDNNIGMAIQTQIEFEQLTKDQFDLGNITEDQYKAFMSFSQVAFNNKSSTFDSKSMEIGIKSSELTQHFVDLALSILSGKNNIEIGSRSTSCWITSALGMNIHAYEQQNGKSPTFNEVMNAVAYGLFVGEIVLNPTERNGKSYIEPSIVKQSYYGNILNAFKDGLVGIKGSWQISAINQNTTYAVGIYNTPVGVHCTWTNDISKGFYDPMHMGGIMNGSPDRNTYGFNLR